MFRARRLLVPLLSCMALACPAPGDGGDEAETGTTDASGSDGSDGSGSDGSDGSDGTAETGLKEGPADPLVDHCDPSLADQCGEFVDPHLCCSDDPAAINLDDLDAFVTPAYMGKGGEGTPVFSAANNALSRSGSCIREGDVPPSNGLAEANALGCPIPCNPTWSAGDITTICGSNSICCAMKELEPEDCVLDPGLGDAGCYRPVTGMDIVGLGGLDATDWASTSHATHQDPSGLGCEAFVAAIPSSVLAEKGIAANDVLLACYRRLTVTNQRGYCLGGAGVNVCPYAAPGYVDACEQLNLDEGLSGC